MNSSNELFTTSPANAVFSKITVRCLRISKTNWDQQIYVSELTILMSSSFILEWNCLMASLQILDSAFCL